MIVLMISLEASILIIGLSLIPMQLCCQGHKYAGKGSTSFYSSSVLLLASIIFMISLLHAHVKFILSKHEHLSDRDTNHFPHDQLGKRWFSKKKSGHMCNWLPGSRR